MKNLIYFFLAFALVLAVSCQNNPQNNTITQQKPLKDSSASVFLLPKDTAQMTNQHLLKKDIDSSKSRLKYRKNSSLPPVILFEEQKYTLSNAINIETLSATKNPLIPSLSPVFDKKSQFFTFNADQETILEGIEGTKLTIPAACFQTETGDILRGVVQLEVKEFFKTSDMILSNLTTLSDGKMLETGGMIYLNAKDAKGHNIRIRPEKNIAILLPPSAKAADKQLFYGHQQTDGRINWTLAQPTITEQNANNYAIIEQNPEFQGGQAALFRFIQNEMVYPKIARENKIQGIVYVGFTVLPDGSLANIEIKRGIGAGCNEEAIRIIKKMPRWRAGRTQNQRVAVAYTLPIKFDLNSVSILGATFQRDTAWTAQDTAYANKYVDILDEQEAVMRSNRLGWINCDRFVSTENTTDFFVQTNKRDAEVLLVFKNYRSIISASSNSEKNAYFKQIPIGEPVFIVATSPEGNQFNISVIETVISKQQSKKIELKPVEKDVFLRELHRLDALK